MRTSPNSLGLRVFMVKRARCDAYSKFAWKSSSFFCSNIVLSTLSWFVRWSAGSRIGDAAAASRCFGLRGGSRPMARRMSSIGFDFAGAFFSGGGEGGGGLCVVGFGLRGLFFPGGGGGGGFFVAVPGVGGAGGETQKSPPP